MANLSEIDYVGVSTYTPQMRKHAEDINTELDKAYQSIANMHNSWYGMRYNDLVKKFNGLIPNFNEILELIVGEIPFILEKVANNYSQADRGEKVVSEQKAAPRKINALTISNDVGMKFITSEVEAVKTEVEKNFTIAIEKMNNYESAYRNIVWNSDAAKVFADKIKKYKADINSAFEDIKNQFTTLMTETLADIQATENANTVQ